MPLNVTLPQLLGSSSSCKDCVVSVLAIEFPLTVKEIFEKVKTMAKEDVSYQGVHKAVLELEEQEVLDKAGGKYELSPEWVSSIKQFVVDIENKQLSVQRLTHKMDFTTPKTITFHNYYEMPVTLAHMFINKTVMGKGPNIAIGIKQYAPWPLRFSFKDFELLRKMTKNIPEIYTLITKDLPLNRWVAEQYLKGGMKGVVIKPELESKYYQEIISHGEGIIQINYSPETQKFLDTVYRNTQNLTDLFKLYTQKTISKTKAEITLTLSKNPGVAGFIREEMLKYFKK